MDLEEVYAEASPSFKAAPLGIALCSDGIWDNWKFEEVAQVCACVPACYVLCGHVSRLLRNVEIGGVPYRS